MFVPFQRLGDTDNTTGVGLGLALSRGLTEAMDGTLEPEDTPGGGLTMALSLPAVPAGTARPGCPGRSSPAEPDERPDRYRRRPGGRAASGEGEVQDDPGARRRRRAADPPRAADQPAGPAVRGVTAETGAQALAEAAHHPPDLVILDLGLPDLDGVEVIEGLRGWTEAPIIVLSGRADSTDKVEALDAGADDYVTKPFGMDELLARMRAVTGAARPRRRAAGQPRRRHHRPGGQAGESSGPDGDKDIRLTPTEWHLLEVLLRHPGKLLSQRQLLQEVWGPGYADATGNLRLYMAQLRRKLEPDPARPRWLLTEPGMGYRFQPGPRTGTLTAARGRTGG